MWSNLANSLDPVYVLMATILVNPSNSLTVIWNKKAPKTDEFPRTRQFTIVKTIQSCDLRRSAHPISDGASCERFAGDLGIKKWDGKSTRD